MHASIWLREWHKKFLCSANVINQLGRFLKLINFNFGPILRSLYVASTDHTYDNLSRRCRWRSPLFHRISCYVECKFYLHRNAYDRRDNKRNFSRRKGQGNRSRRRKFSVTMLSLEVLARILRWRLCGNYKGPWHLIISALLGKQKVTIVHLALLCNHLGPRIPGNSNNPVGV